MTESNWHYLIEMVTLCIMTYLSYQARQNHVALNSRLSELLISARREAMGIGHAAGLAQGQAQGDVKTEAERNRPTPLEVRFGPESTP